MPEADMVLAIGLMSGTSCDGVDAALVDITEDERASGGLAVRLCAFITVPYEASFRRELLHLIDSTSSSIDKDGDTVSSSTSSKVRSEHQLSFAKVAAINSRLGHRLAEAAIAVAERAEVALSDIQFIGSHGHTMYHGPRDSPPTTLQLGESAVIAARTGCTCVSDFRPADVAMGGEGAPLLPAVDWLLHAACPEDDAAGDMTSRHMRPQNGCLILNIGGIANITAIGPTHTDTSSTARAPDVHDATGRDCLSRLSSSPRLLAFDCGPGNMLMDAAMELVTRGVSTYDKDGALAARGNVSAPALQWLMQHPHLSRPIPKSTGREEFGKTYLQAFLGAFPDMRTSHDDLLATLNRYSAECIADSIKRHIRTHVWWDAKPLPSVWVCGGGTHNATLMQNLGDLLKQLDSRVEPYSALDPDAREAACFAVLGYKTLRSEPVSLPCVTGCSQPCILGKITPSPVPSTHLQ